MTRPSFVSTPRNLPSRIAASVAALAMTLFVLASSDALATQAESAAPNVTVKFAVDEAGKPADAPALYARLKTAARQVCRVGDEKLGLREYSSARRCYQEALARAVHAVDLPLVTSLHTAELRNLG